MKSPTDQPLSMDWNEASHTLRKVALLEDVFREKMESDSMFEEVAMSGMKFLHKLIESWEPLYAEDPEDALGEMQGEHQRDHMFNFKSEGAFFFLDAARLRQLRDRLRNGRHESDVSVLNSYADE